MDSDDLGYNERIPHESAANRPFQLQFPLGQSSSTPRTGRPRQQGPRQSHPTIFARSSPTPNPHPRFSMPNLQSPTRGDFMNDKENVPQDQQMFKIFPQPHNSKPLSTPCIPFKLNDQYQTMQRRISSHSDAGFEGEGGLEDVIRKVREAGQLKAQLAEDRMTISNLRADLTTSQNSALAAKQRVSILESENERQSSQIQTLNADLGQTKNELERTTQEQHRIGETLRVRDVEITRLRNDLQGANDRHRETEDRVSKVKEHARKSLENIGKNYTSLKTSYDELKLRFDVSEENLQRTKEDIEDLRISSDRHLKLVESHLDENGRYLHKSAETRELLAELQHDRQGCQQVIDILREKLSAMGSLLIESRQRVADLELRQAEGAARWDRRSETLRDLEAKVEDLADKLAKREGDSFDIMLESANMSSRVRESDDRTNETQNALDAKERELVALQTKFDNLETSKLKEWENKIRELSSKLSVAEIKVHVSVEKMQMLNERNTSLSSTVEQSRQTIERLQTDLQESKYACIAETNKLKQAQDKLSILQPETLKLKKEIIEAQSEIHRHANQSTILQERFDSQEMTLKLAKEHSGDLQDQLFKSQTMSATELERAVSEARRDVAVLEEQKESLERLLLERNAAIVKLEESCTAAASSHTELLEQIATLEASFKTQMVGLQTTFSKQIAAGDKRAKEQRSAYDSATKTLQDQKASLDRTIKSLQNESKVHQTEMTDLKVEMARQQESFDRCLKTERASVAEAQHALAQLQPFAKEAEALLARSTEESLRLEDKARLAADTADSAKAELITINAKLDGMEGELSDLRLREKTLASRYKAGKLNDAEKTFVQSLLQMTQEMYEQDVVNKENELRSKDGMISSMQGKISSLESTLAKCLKKQAGDSRPMVDLNLWMSSPQQVTLKSPTPPKAEPGPSKPLPTGRPKLILKDVINEIFDHDKPLCDNDPILPISTQSLGKRERAASPTYEEPPRPTRKSKSAASKKSVDKTADTSSKVRPTRKRR